MGLLLRYFGKIESLFYNRSPGKLHRFTKSNRADDGLGRIRCDILPVFSGGR